MLPSSHVVPMKQRSAAPFDNPRLLADAFSEFISASALLEASYRDLQQEVAQLSVALADRNAELTRSLAENSRMRAALQQTIDSMPCGVMVLDAAESIVTINPEGRRLLGVGRAEPRTLRELSRLAQVDFESMVGASQGPHDNEVCLSSAAGMRWLAIGRRDLSPVPADAGAHAPLESIWILRDITAARRAELEREGARRATTLAEISTMLAHEIRNPLASLELFASLLAEDGGQNSQWIAHLRAGIRTLSGTVNNVLSLNGEVSPRLAPVNLPLCVQGGIEFVRPVAEQAGVALSFHSSGPITVEGNEDGIRQIVLNLACNAIRHTPAGGKVDVAVWQEARGGGRAAIVEVRDTGCGIAEELIGHLFEAGFSGTGETPGLGLAVCSRLMTQHRGTIRASSRAGCGSTFHLEFPAI